MSDLLRIKNFVVGGADGFCRHIVAVLFEVENYLNDRNCQSVTSSQCMWVKRANPNTCPVPVIEIETDIMEEHMPLPVEEQYNPFPPSVSIPKSEGFLQVIEKHIPRACIIDTQTFLHLTVFSFKLSCKSGFGNE